jgi:hypothetical protein
MTDAPAILWQTGECGLCDAVGAICVGVAVRVRGADRYVACPNCLEALRLGLILPETRRVLVIGADWTMLQVLKPGQEQDRPPAIPQAGRARELVEELARMVEDDPNRGTPHETAFFHETRVRAREIGGELYELGGHALMVSAYDVIRERYGHSARSLEVNWNGVGEWFD